jgi:hypothetical protein
MMAEQLKINGNRTNENRNTCKFNQVNHNKCDKLLAYNIKATFMETEQRYLVTQQNNISHILNN